MPTESQAAEARRVLTEHAVQLEDIDKKIEALGVNRDQQVQLIVDETGPEIKRLRALLKEHQEALLVVKEQKRTHIEAVDKQWKEKTRALQTKRIRIQTSSNVQHSLLAPVRKIPSELLASIFEHFVREGGSPWTLALVCVAWNKVVFSTRTSWSTIHVEIDLNSIRTATLSRKRLEAHLRRAGTRTLLDVRVFFKSESKRTSTTQILKSCELIGGRDMLARWRSVTLVQPPSKLTPEQLALFAHPLPNLHSLSIEWEFSSNLLDILLKMIDASAKVFRSLSICQWTETDFGAYPNILKRVEVLRGTHNERQYAHKPALSESLSSMRALKEVELPGVIVKHSLNLDWMRSVEKATFTRLDLGSTNIFDPQKEYHHNLCQLSLIHCSPSYPQQLQIKAPNLRFFKVVGDLEVASCFDTPVLDDLVLISGVRAWTRDSEKREEEVLKGLRDNPSLILKIRHLQLETMASPARTIEFLKKLSVLERLTVQEHPTRTLSDLFAALKETEDAVHADGSSSQRKMVVCPTLHNLTVKAQSKSCPHISAWITEVVTVRRNVGETFEGVALEM